MLEYLLFGAQARGDTKPAAKALLARFGSLAGVFDAEPREERFRRGLGVATRLRAEQQVFEHFVVGQRLGPALEQALAQASPVPGCAVRGFCSGFRLFVGQACPPA